uniref:Uncharacterized protein n=1 Tax=Romanomermis culicivorax TaxID=13658 RepID=A0A915I7Z2_ROMCU
MKTNLALDFAEKWGKVASKPNLSFRQVVAEIVGYAKVGKISNTGHHCQGDKGVKDQLNRSTEDRLQSVNDVVLLTSNHMVSRQTDTF